jgi:hypothetical protein
VIPNVTRGADGAGLVRYLFGAGKANEHTDQRVIAAGEGIEARQGVPLSHDEVADLAAQLEVPKRLYGTEVAGGHVWHLSLANPAADRELSDGEWAGVVKATMDRLGFSSASGKAPCPWVAVRHGRSSAGNDHVHVAVSLVREDGTKATTWLDWVRLSELCGDFERRLGLTVVEGRSHGGLPAPGRAEIEAAARRGRLETERETLARTVRAAAVLSRDEAEFVRRLRSGGVLARPRYATGGTTEVVGYSVALRPVEGAQPIWFGGGKLGRDLALPALRVAWDRSGDTEAEALEVWSGRGPTRSDGQESVVLGSVGWRRAAERVGKAADALSQVPARDRARWASAARETSGVFGAWAGRIERVAPGALARAADTLAWSAQARGPYRPAERERSVVDFRGVAGVAAQAVITADTAAGWMLLMQQMMRTIEVIRRAHEERGEALQAAKLARLVAGELTQRHRELELAVVAGRAPSPGTSPQALDPRLGQSYPGQDKGFGR